MLKEAIVSKPSSGNKFLSAAEEEADLGILKLFSFFNGPSPASFCLFSSLLQTNNTIFTTNQCENVQQVYSAGIRTHVLQNMSLLP